MNRTLMNDHSRRDFLLNSAHGFGALALSDLLRRDARASEASVTNPLAVKPQHFAAQAKHVIFLFMQGGPSQVETFDPKPAMKKFDGQLLPAELRDFDLAQINTADAKIMAPLFEFQKHGESGIEIASLFPELAKHADKLAVIRSVYHDLFIHGSALTMMHTGTQVLAHPSVGSWVTYGLGSETDSLPAYVAMTDAYFRNGAATFSSGFLPAAYQGTYLRTQGTAIQNLNRPEALQSDEQRRLLDQINQWNARHRDARPGDSRLDARIANYELAFRMQSAAPDLIDLSQETQAIRELYGIDKEPTATFGKMCLLSRRMVERGVRYIHLVDVDWDGHGNCKGNHEGQAKKVDKPIAALLEDLHQRGLLDETLIVWGGEFGRTPIMQGSDGRDHHPYGFSMWMAGGGIQGGKTIGATDDFGFQAVEDKVHVNDIHGTMLSLLGLDHEALTYLFEGREQRLTNVGGYSDFSARLTKA
ncbi:MAG: sulfatase [Planctomycetaceae bacterium]|nr:sulfatase [Planctomycetaceae bacterium]